MRVLTRGDLDGLTSTVLLTLVEKIREIRFAHPKDAQDGLVPCTSEDIVVNLPFVNGCGMWFDHHISEEQKVEKMGSFKGRFAIAPSTARVIYDHYRNPMFDQFKELLEATDRLDSAQLTKEEVSNPSGWILLGLTLDPRTGLGPEFQKYFRWLAEYVKEVSLEKVLKHPEVKKRCDQVLQEQTKYVQFLKFNCKQEGSVIISDFRDAGIVPTGNRFVVFTLFPTANVEVRIFKGLNNKIVVAAGHSIFNRTCNVNAGEYLAKFGGGGHKGAGTCQLAPDEAEKEIAEIITHFKANK